MAEKIRLEFNPRKLGEDGILELHAVLISVLPDGWPYVIKHGVITRIDIGVDVPGVRMDEFLFLPKQGATKIEWGVGGHLETFRLGKAKGNQTLIYSKKKQRLSKGQPWVGQSVVRVERRLRNPKAKKLADLVSMENPFGSMVLTTVMPPPPPGEKDWTWSMFEDSVNVRGLDKALALLPEGRRSKYRKYLEQHSQPWWDPDAIWAKWPDILATLKLTSAKGFI